ncbi:MAG: hydroxyethylthiazole kinase [Deltaproteobacteria bacterium]|nr:hydroxyethylthiazole kinase [Deltaproteobacteria bacterium]MBW1943634.1 hydroxyethylthiazole kinase [Deltaproteobacteria bacterium]
MYSEDLAQKAADNLKAIREKKPLIHNITNYVVMNTTANALLACGASPVMAHAAEEVEEMVSFAGALVLNIGTLTPPWIDSMIRAGKRANELNVPIVLDPVGSGATALRTESAKRIIDELNVTVVRGNASEVLSLAHEGSRTKGVDSIHSVDEASDAAVVLANELNTTLVITGEVDLVTDGIRIHLIYNGDPLMGYVTGTGCMATTMIGAFMAVDQDAVNGASTALAYYGLAGERAASKAEGPGTFQAMLFDALYGLDEKAVKEGAKIRT